MIIHDFVIPLIIVGLSVLLFVLLRPESNEEIDQNLNHKEGDMQEEPSSHPAGLGEISFSKDLSEMIDDSLSFHKDIHGVAPWVEDHFKRMIDDSLSLHKDIYGVAPWVEDHFEQMIDDSLSLHKDIYGVAPWVEDHFK